MKYFGITASASRIRKAQSISTTFQQAETLAAYPVLPESSPRCQKDPPKRVGQTIFFVVCQPKRVGQTIVFCRLSAAFARETGDNRQVGGKREWMAG
jgi:hypothetical protein